ncbi:hypothetical protein BDV32DRAFT_154084 [Aspergillus pseudonomiae]|nr:hypothetical protein BDV32DRAFT_154084 [Aspergillus pseudonomiae]
MSTTVTKGSERAEWEVTAPFTGVIYKKNFIGEATTALEAELFTHVPVTMNESTKTIANPSGHDLLQQIRDDLEVHQKAIDGLQEQNDAQQRAIDDLMERVAPYREIRKSVLCGGLSSNKQRNEAAHGGNIREDYFFIRGERNTSLAEKCRERFEQIYGFQLSEFQDRIPTAPARVIEAFNMHGNCILLYRWNKSQKQGVKKQVLSKLRQLLLPWVQNLTPVDYLEDGSPSLPFYDNIVSLYESV